MGEKKNSKLCILGSFGYSNLTYIQLKQRFAVKIRCSFDKKNKTKTKWPWLSSWEWDFPCSSVGKESACNAESLGSIPGWEDPLEKEMATHSSILLWSIPWTEEPARLQSMGSQESDMT